MEERVPRFVDRVVERILLGAVGLLLATLLVVLLFLIGMTGFPILRAVYQGD